LTTGLSSGFKQEFTSQINHRVGQQHLEVVIVNRVVLRPREHPIGGLVAGHEAAMSDVLLRLAGCPAMVHRNRAVAGRQGWEKLNDIKLFKAHLRVH